MRSSLLATPPSPTVLLVSSLKVLAVTLPEVSTLPTSATTRRASSAQRRGLMNCSEQISVAQRRTAALLLHARCRDVAPKGFAVNSIRDSGTAKTARPILQACRNTLSPSWARCSFRRSPGRLRQVLYSITKHAMRRSADEIGATSISFRPKVFSDPASVVD